jgi:predicted DNA-binding protein
MSTVLPIRLSAQEKRRALALAKKRGLPLATYLKQLIQRDAETSAPFNIGGKAPKIPKGPLTRGSAYA